MQTIVLHFWLALRLALLPAATFAVLFEPSDARLLPAAIQQNPMHQVLPRQGLADAVRIGKPQRADDTEGMYPKTGYARGQKPGLATMPEHPVSGPLMPIASNFFPYGPSPLGQP